MCTIMAAATLAALAACTPAPPENTASAAADAACRAQGDATYNALDEDQLARTSQAGLMFAPQPNHVFDAEQMGAMHERDTEVANCERNGTEAAGSVPAGPLTGNIVTPHIVQSP